MKKNKDIRTNLGSLNDCNDTNNNEEGDENKNLKTRII